MTGDHQSWKERVAPVERSGVQARSTYDRLAPWYDLVEAPFERQARAAGLEQLAPQPGERILEIGFGTGHTLTSVARRVGRSGTVLGVDVSTQMVRVARRRTRRSHPTVRPGLIQAEPHRATSDQRSPSRDAAR